MRSPLTYIIGKGKNRGGASFIGEDGILEVAKGAKAEGTIPTPSAPTGLAAQVVSSYHSMAFTGAEYVDLTTLGSFASAMEVSTFECWFKTTSSTAMTLASTFNDGSNTAFRAELNRQTNGTNMPGTYYTYTREDGGTSEVSSNNELDGINLYDGNWHKITIQRRVIIEFNSFAHFVWIDGNAVNVVNFGSLGSNPAFSNFQYAMTLGRGNNRGTVDLFPFIGKIAFPVFWATGKYNVADNPLPNWQNLPDTSDPDLHAFWGFQEGSGSAASDLSGNGFDATLVPGAGSLSSMWDLDIPEVVEV